MVPLSSRAVRVLNGCLPFRHLTEGYKSHPVRFYRPEHLEIQDWHLTFPSMEQSCPLNWEEWQWPPFYNRCFVVHIWSSEDPSLLLCPSVRAWLPAGYSLCSLSGLVRPNKWKQTKTSQGHASTYLAPPWKLHPQSWTVCFQHSINDARN